MFASVSHVTGSHDSLFNCVAVESGWSKQHVHPCVINAVTLIAHKLVLVGFLSAPPKKQPVSPGTKDQPIEDSQLSM